MIRAYFQHSNFSHGFSLFTQMRNSETKPDNFTFACVLRALSELTDRGGLKLIHGCVVVSGLGSDAVSSSSLVRAYSKLGLIDDACRVFYGTLELDLAMYNSMISGYGYAGLWQQGLELYSRMRRLGERPDGCTLVGLMSCFCNPNQLKIVLGIHGLCLKMGLVLNAHVGSALVSMYSRCNCLNSAHQIFNSLSGCDLVLWSSLITGFSQSGECDKALVLFAQMINVGMKPDPILIASVLSACSRLAAIKPGKEIHGYVFRCGFRLEVMVSSALIDMYGKCGFPSLGAQVFEMMQERNVVAYNSVISCLGSNGLGHMSIKTFEEMLVNGVKPDQSTFSALLSACCHTGLVEEGRTFFQQMESRFGITPGTEHYVYMVKLLAMGGDLEDAYHLIENMPVLPDSGIWGALLTGCSVHGNVKLGETIARRLFEIDPEKPAYRVMLSNMYAEDGRWNDVQSLRDEMVGSGLRKTPGLSWIAEGKV